MKGAGPEVKKKAWSRNIRYASFKPNPREITLEEENRLLSDDIISAILDSRTTSFTVKTIESCNKKPASKEDYDQVRRLPNYDLIINKILQKLPEMEIKLISQLCNTTK